MKKKLLLTAVLNLAVLGWAQNITVAVTDFTARSGYSGDELADMTELFAGIMREYGGVRVLTRSQWEAILKEHTFQRGSLVDPKEIRQLGEALGAQAVVTGTLMKLGNANILNMSLLDVVSGEMLSTARRTFESLDQFMDLLPALATDMAKLLRKSNPLYGRWKVDGRSTILVFTDNGTFEAQSCDFLNNFKVVDRVTASGRTGYKFQYHYYLGNVRGSFSTTEREIAVSGRFDGVRQNWQIWNDNSGKRMVDEETSNWNTSETFTYKLIGTDKLEITGCWYLRGRYSLKDDSANYGYYTKLTKIN
ncbi:MAG: hypothetical protein LBG05_00335 [Treponema sp.]|jgi:TolB-like protein|nr:hypothetical protein [Treponema sp.]